LGRRHPERLPYCLEQVHRILTLALNPPRSKLQSGFFG
jgi:hypothetical protein